uniref:PedP n=1 Tax=symbiont bacterium of Paederus fuscipes TaxID=176282 RepID=Q5I687_UNCXX|nr:PedP [symbiont bacterium of Paederus fuscipes]
MPVGIEAMNLYGGSAFVDVMELAVYRKHDLSRFDNLLMKQKTVALPYEDSVSFAINAAQPLIDTLSETEKERIELLITCSESGIDFGKSISTYIHHYLGLNRNCRLFELKQACYSGTAGLQMAVNFIVSKVSPGAKALVIASDLSRFLVTRDEEGELTMDWDFFEPSGGAGAIAMLVSEKPDIFELDIGANGYYTYEVMDTCRPIADSEAGNADLSLLSYLDCCDQSFKEYKKRVFKVDYCDTFQYLCFHTPFGGMVKGAHRNMMRKYSDLSREAIEADFQQRVQPGLTYCQRVGNIMGGTIMLSLASTIDNAIMRNTCRVGCFSYGSGCCSEFYSGVVSPSGQAKLRDWALGKHLDSRHRLTMEQYEIVLQRSELVKFGTRNVVLSNDLIPGAWKTITRNVRENKDIDIGKRIFLSEIKEFHRHYEWIE